MSKCPVASRDDKPKVLTSCLQIAAFFHDILYPVVDSRASRALVTFQQSLLVCRASNRSSMYWSRVQLKVSLGKAARSTARTSPNRVGEFLKPCSSRVQVNCVCLLVCGSYHSKAKKGWLARDSRNRRHR